MSLPLLPAETQKFITNLNAMRSAEDEFRQKYSGEQPYARSFERAVQMLVMACAERMSVAEFQAAIQTAKERLEA